MNATPKTPSPRIARGVHQSHVDRVVGLNKFRDSMDAGRFTSGRQANGAGLTHRCKFGAGFFGAGARNPPEVSSRASAAERASALTYGGTP